MTLLHNFTRGVVTSVMKRHTGGEGVKKWAKWRYVINEWPLSNKTGLQPVSRPVEQILGFFPKGFKKGSFFCCWLAT